MRDLEKSLIFCGEIGKSPSFFCYKIKKVAHFFVISLEICRDCGTMLIQKGIESTSDSMCAEAHEIMVQC